MYIESVPNRNSPPAILLRESFREDGRVKKRTIANLSRWPEKLVVDMKASLSGKTVGQENYTAESAVFESGPIFGVLNVLEQLAQQVGLKKSLGQSRLGKLTMFLVLTRLAHQGSRLSAVRWARNHAVKEALGLNYFNEDDLYKALDWAEEDQQRIERDLFKTYLKSTGTPPLLVLYDITSSYFEGLENEYAEYGYNRDKKNGKKQVVIGLLTGPDGEPLSIQVFQGNTTDSTTVGSQVAKIEKQFGIKEVVFVGDRGMVKSTGKKALADVEGFRYITALTDPQVRKLLKNGVIQPSLFSEDVVAVIDGDVRYILRRCEIRQRKEQHRRRDKIACLQEKISKRNEFVRSSRRAQPESGLRRLSSWTRRYKLSSFIELSLVGGRIATTIDEAAKSKDELLDGCYVVVTDVPESQLDELAVWERYGDLQKVERNFRSLKTALLEVRPIFVRKRSRTRGHVFISMLALKISRLMESRLSAAFQTTRTSGDAITVDDAIAALSRISINYFSIAGQVVPGIPKCDKYQQSILAALKVKLAPPASIPTGTVPSN